MSALDELAPVYEVRMVESVGVSQRPHLVDAAFREVTPDEMPLARRLTAVRIGLRRIRDGRNRRRPFLETMERLGWTRLADDPGRQVVIGLIGKVWRPGFGIHRVYSRREFEGFNRRGYAKVVLAYHFDPADRGSRLSCEMRVQTTDRRSAQRFRWYWRLIRLGARWTLRSGLHAIKRRAERAPTPTEAAPPPHAAPAPP